MLCSGDIEKIRAEIALVDDRISEIGALVSEVRGKIERIRDELSDEEDVRSTKGENRAFYLTITRNITLLRSELDVLYGARSELFAERDGLFERKRELYDRLKYA